MLTEEFLYNFVWDFLAFLLINMKVGEITNNFLQFITSYAIAHGSQQTDNLIIESSSLSDKYLVVFVAFSIQKDLFLIFFKVGRQAQSSLHFIFAATFFQFLQSALNEEVAKCGSVYFFLLHKNMQWLLLILQEKLEQTVKKNIIAVKPIVLSVLTDRNWPWQHLLLPSSCW